MKHIVILLVVLAGLLNTPVSSYPQDSPYLELSTGKIFITGNLQEYPANSMEYHKSDMLSEAKKIAAQKRAAYSKSGIYKGTDQHPVYQIPVQVSESFTDPGFFSITAHFDHDTLFPGHLKDFACGTLTYDSETGYNHMGTDFFPWPFPWYKMFHQEVIIVAAAPGILMYKQEGNFDLQCEENSDAWNGVCLLHADGSTSWYVHMKKNSVTVKNIGETIAQDEYLGIVGSSGSSLSPHLHFEVLDENDNAIDPFIGTCNPDITESWWTAQLPYRETGVNKISTNAHLPAFPDCPQEEIPNESDIFYPGDTIFLLSYFRNIALGDQVDVMIKRPDNSVFAEWEWTNPNGFYSASWLFFFMFIHEEMFGQWNYSLTYKGITYEHPFQLKQAQSIHDADEEIILKAYPIPATREVWITFSEPNTGFVEYHLNDLTGRTLISGNLQQPVLNSLRLDLSDIRTGVYLLTVKSQNVAKTCKVIRQ